MINCQMILLETTLWLIMDGDNFYSQIFLEEACISSMKINGKLLEDNKVGKKLVKVVLNLLTIDRS